MRLTGIEVNECPKFLARNPTEADHSLLFLDHDIRIPLQLEGIISYISTRIPTRNELADHEGQYLLMTPNVSDWDPHTTTFRDQEYNMTDYNGNVREEKKKGNLMVHEIMELVAENIERSSTIRLPFFFFSLTLPL